MQTNLDTLDVLAWLVEAGADEAVGEGPVNRLQAKAASRTSNPPLEGGSKFAKRSARISGRGKFHDL
jgi:hypothetical protein